MGKMIVLMISIICLCTITGCAETKPDETVVVLAWKDARLEVKASEWNEHSVQIRTEDIGLGNGKVYDFIGVRLSDLMELADANECVKARVKSTDGWIGEIPAEDIRSYDIALVNGYSDGKSLKADAGGPVKIVFPVSEHPELKEIYNARHWQWYVCEVEFVEHTAEGKNQLAHAPPAGDTGESDSVSAVPPTGVKGEIDSASVEPLTEKTDKPVDAHDTEFGHANKCVIIVLDGFSSNYLSRLGQESNLIDISEEGARCLSARSTYPTHTCTNHATIMTGAGAARHGIVGNDRLGEDGVTSVKNIQPDMIRVPTLFQIASAAGKKTAFVSGKDNMVTLFSRGLDIGVSNERPTEYLPAAPEPVDNSNNDEYFRYHMELADWVFESLFTVLEEENPDLTMVNIQSTDYLAHRFGPESKEMDECLSAVDERLGELFRKMESAGMLERTAVIVTADHGMTPSDKAIPLNALSFMNFPGAGSVVDGRNGYIWYGNEDREAVIRFYENIEGIRNVFERESDEARSLDVDFPDGPDLFLETEPGYVFLPEPMIDLYHGQHGSRDDSDAIIPLICLGSGIPTNAEIESTDLRCIAPLVCHLLQITPGDFDLEVPTIYKTGE